MCVCVCVCVCVHEERSLRQTSASDQIHERRNHYVRKEHCLESLIQLGVGVGDGSEEEGI